MATEFIRFGQIPANGKSIVWYRLTLDEQHDINYSLKYTCSTLEDALRENHIDTERKNLWEDGLSVFALDEDGMPRIDNLQQAVSLASRIDDTPYIVTGTQTSTGTDNEPIVKVDAVRTACVNRADLVEKIERVLKEKYQTINDEPMMMSDNRIYCYFNSEKYVVTYQGKEYTDPVEGWNTQLGIYAYRKREA